MKTVVWTEDTAWEATVRQAEQEEVLVMRDGHVVALLMPFDDDDLEWYARERDPEFLASLARARRQVQEGRTITPWRPEEKFAVVENGPYFASCFFPPEPGCLVRRSFLVRFTNNVTVRTESRRVGQDRVASAGPP